MKTHRQRRRTAALTAAIAVTALAVGLAPGASWAETTTPSPEPTETAAPTETPDPTDAPNAPETTPDPSPSVTPTETAPADPSAGRSAGQAAPRSDTGVTALSASGPYMGWSSYSMQVYEGGQWITADQIMAQSDAMHDKLQKFGYEYINIDAGWNGGQDEYGRPIPSTTLYPDGLDAVIDHIHDNGQKVGLYLIPGMSLETAQKALPIYNAPGCTTENLLKQPLQQGDYWGFGYRLDFDNPCTTKYIDSIADLLGEWGVDFIKFDSVTPGSGVSDLSMDAREEVAAWSQALARNDIWFELSWAVDIDYADYWKQYADGWRVDWDVECYCGDEALTTWENVARLFPRLSDWWRHGGPAGWNDLDSLNVGNGKMDGLTKDERRTAATLWATAAAPFYLGNDLTNLDEYGLELVTNPEVIAVNQAGVPARPVSTATKHQVWYALNADGTYTVALYNLGRADADITVDFADIGLDGSAKVRDLWSKKNLGTVDGSFTAESVPIHGARLLRVTPAKQSVLTVNDDALRVAYAGDWTRNGGAELPATSQPFTVAVTDTPGAGTPNPPATGVTVTLNDDDSRIAYSGSWGDSNNRGLGDHGDDVHYAEANGAAFQYTFQGTGIQYVTEKHESQGDVEVYLDGQLVDTVSTYLDPADGRLSQQVVYSVSDLPSGSHTLRVVKKSGSFMLLDKLVVTLDSQLSTTSGAFNKAAPADVSVDLLRDPSALSSISAGGTALERDVDYTVNGSTVTLASAYLATLPVGDAVLDFAFAGDHLDDVHSTTTDGDRVSFTFRGTAVSWIAPKGPDQGTVDVYLDGSKVETVDTHSATRLTSQELFTATGLKDKEHTIEIVKTSGEVLRTDVFAYTVKKVG
ncbi:X2-like carbohydrate binding domain-containing protein [Microbacterium hydrocarbonoxydans]|uniref:X2-like carbohydrate binding domain-containing protein n=1 Tax=Microbacterium hydrocarbonoxydans TaxID=273678 RepID=UPI002041FCC5|nr:X2-like carbohydrate binding domain-containing protein [Microbacterium hydrocarbonoxydans]MCM3779226.1 alpha-galactosidase [Microbacterium hydrocarbonoxydans]